MKGNYNIQQVSDVTGLSKQVIRKWEERYQLIEPERMDNGYRLYQDQDIATLLRVKRLSDEGYTIKQAALLIEKEREAEQSGNSLTPVPVVEEWNDYVFKLLEYGANCEELELNRTLHRAHQDLGLDLFLSSVVLPFLREVGTRWEKKQWDEYQEAVSSMVVRDFLVQIRRNYPYREDAPLVLGACIPGEYHEVPLHILLLQFMVRGWKSFMIGASPASGCIESLVERLRPKFVLLSASTTVPLKQHPETMEKLNEFAKNYPKIKFFAGGKGMESYLQTHHLDAIKFAPDLNAILEEAL
ncbi:MarR family transcriptional regulator [Tetzosporium hominis]|uniref:MarR family transcriptional regulator n=1 Tax=Tetzosporium hominis TaxID=2020506 RepID=A0A264W2T3_9BACL|nr:MerR family transcriptional regulator [Tetzosporium hominis]OZS77880.1 MarR family transcriptional regulator [Tetzosporium hominis]